MRGLINLRQRPVRVRLIRIRSTANLDVIEARNVYQDLMDAIENGLILKNYLHLFYLVTPYTAAEEIPIDRQVAISIVRSCSACHKFCRLP